MTNSPCRYVEDQGYLLKAHMPYCKDVACRGCVPCTHDNYGNPLRHCTARQHCSNHLEAAERLTCSNCVARTAGHIAEIVRWSDEVYDEALEEGVDSEAANLAGPAADPIRAMWARINANRGVEVEDRAWEAEDKHPLTVLGGYEMRLREDYSEDYSELPPITIDGAATYLQARLNRIAQDETQDWPYLASEIASCHSHLAEVLHLARRPEKGAPCIACEKAPALVKKYTHHDLTGDSDRWVCPNPDCRAWWPEVAYRQWVSDDYLDNAETLTAAEMHQVYEIKPSTLRTWADRNTGLKRGKNTRGQQTYDVAMARRLHDRAQLLDSAEAS